MGNSALSGVVSGALYNLFTIVCVFTAAALFLKLITHNLKRRTPKTKYRNHGSPFSVDQKAHPRTSPRANPTLETQSASSLSVSYFKKRLINKSEERVYASLHKLIEKNNVNAYVFSQVSYGEIIGCKGEDAFRTYATFNSKRADFVVTDHNFNTLAVIEYHGEGHFNGADMTKSDNTKKAACEAAGINFITIHYSEKDWLLEYLEIHLLPIIKAA